MTKNCQNGGPKYVTFRINYFKFAGIVGPCYENEWPTLITDNWKYSDGKRWIDANQEHVKFLDLSNKIDAEPPLKMKLQLSGEVKNVQWKRAGPWNKRNLIAKTINGIYYLGSKEVNGYPYWVHEDQNQGFWQNQAIWFNRISKAWFIGDIEDLGENISGISGEFIVDFQTFVCLLQSVK